MDVSVPIPRSRIARAPARVNLKTDVPGTIQSPQGGPCRRCASARRPGWLSLARTSHQSRVWSSRQWTRARTRPKVLSETRPGLRLKTARTAGGSCALIRQAPMTPRNAVRDLPGLGGHLQGDLEDLESVVREQERVCIGPSLSTRPSRPPSPVFPRHPSPPGRARGPSGRDAPPTGETGLGLETPTGSGIGRRGSGRQRCRGRKSGESPVRTVDRTVTGGGGHSAGENESVLPTSLSRGAVRVDCYERR